MTWTIIRNPWRAAAPRRRAHAHSGTHSYVYVAVDGDRLRGNLQFPIDDLNRVTGLAIPQDEAGATAAIVADLATIEAYAADHLTLSAAERSWPLDFTGYRVLERKAGSYAILEYVARPGGPIPRRFTVAYDGVVEQNHHHEAIVIVKTAAGVGKLRTESEQRLPVTAGATSLEVTIPEETLVNDAKGAVQFVAATSKELLRRLRKRLRR
jgi:hypothetical protein